MPRREPGELKIKSKSQNQSIKEGVETEVLSTIAKECMEEGRGS
jgi:hypothetical protein